MRRSWSVLLFALLCGCGGKIGPLWPLCGRIQQKLNVATWEERCACSSYPEDGCPTVADAWAPDTPVFDTFGPRMNGLKYDFHRGIDIKADPGTAVFAVMGGKVVFAGEDPVNFPGLGTFIHLRHTPFADTYYAHLSFISDRIRGKPGTAVKQGDFIGRTGQSGQATFPHLHFETRERTGAPKSTGDAQRDAVHPLRWLTYDNSGGASNFAVSILVQEPINPSNPQVTVTATTTSVIELDLQKVGVQVFSYEDGLLKEVSQSTPDTTKEECPSDDEPKPTPEGASYIVNPPFFDMALTSLQYTYQKGDGTSGGYAYSAFLPGGAHESPFACKLPASSSDFDYGFHLDNPQFNGMTIEVADYKAPAMPGGTFTPYKLSVKFRRLVGAPDPKTLCIKAFAEDVREKRTPMVSWGNCP